MKSKVLAAGMIAALGLAATPAHAADLKDDYTVYEYDRSPYEDQRYGDIFRQPKITERHGSQERHDDRSYKDRRHDDRSTKDRRNRGYDEGDRHRYGTYDDRKSRHFSKWDRHKRHYRQGCRRKSKIRRRLHRRGWHEFSLIRAYDGIAVLKARYRRGNYYRLSVDRCSGKVVRSRLLERHHRDTYAYRPRRHRRTY